MTLERLNLVSSNVIEFIDFKVFSTAYNKILSFKEKNHLVMFRLAIAVSLNFLPCPDEDSQQPIFQRSER